MVKSKGNTPLTLVPYDELVSMGHRAEGSHEGYSVQAICEELRHRQVRQLAQQQRRATWAMVVLRSGSGNLNRGISGIAA